MLCDRKTRLQELSKQDSLSCSYRQWLSRSTQYSRSPEQSSYTPVILWLSQWDCQGRDACHSRGSVDTQGSTSWACFGAYLVLLTLSTHFHMIWCTSSSWMHVPTLWHGGLACSRTLTPLEMNFKSQLTIGNELSSWWNWYQHHSFASFLTFQHWDIHTLLRVGAFGFFTLLPMHWMEFSQSNTMITSWISLESLDKPCHLIWQRKKLSQHFKTSVWTGWQTMKSYIINTKRNEPQHAQQQYMQ